MTGETPALPAEIVAPYLSAVATPTADRHGAVLGPVPATREKPDGSVEATYDWTVVVTSATPLLPIEDARAAVAELSKALRPCGIETGIELSELLLGFYPVRKLYDPDVFVRGLASAFAAHPADIGVLAIDEVTRRPIYLPTRGDVYDACARLTRFREHARRVAEAHVREHRRRDAERAEDDRRTAENAAFEAEHGDAFRAWLELPIFGRPPFMEFSAGFKTGVKKS